jgi:hypothetical protein
MELTISLSRSFGVRSLRNEYTDFLKVGRALLGNLLLDELNQTEKDVYHREKPMFDVGRMAELSAQAYYSHTAAVVVARTDGAHELLQSIQPTQPIPTEVVARKDGSAHIFDSRYYLGRLGESAMVKDMAAVWLVGSLLKVGDALSANSYFDHGPDVELLYHLRNGVAHGNRFNIDNRGKKRLAKWPANNKFAYVRVPGADFEISEQLNGKQVLFDFMGPGDVLDLLMSIGVRFTRLRDRLI